MKKKYIAVLVLILVVLAGVGFQLYQFYKVKNGIKIEGYSSPDISTEGIGPIPTEIHIDFNINVRNTSSYSLEIEELTYNVRVEGRRFGHHNIRDITLNAHSITPVHVSLDFTSMDAVKTLWDYMVGGGFEFRVSGNVEVPFKLFGVVKVTTISITYSESRYLQREGLVGGKVKTATSITLQPPPSQVRKGEIVRFEGRLTVEGGEGLPNKEIQIADDDGIGDDVIAKGFTDKNGYYSISGSAKHTDPLGGDPEIYARFLGSSNYGESNSGERYEVEVVSKEVEIRKPSENIEIEK